MQKLRDGWAWLQSKLIDYVTKLFAQVLRQGPVPDHVAFIPDGNRRFARLTHITRGDAWMKGASAFPGAKVLGNAGCQRPEEEVESIMKLFEDFVPQLCIAGSIVYEYDIRVNVFGRPEMFPESVQRDLRRLQEVTRHHKSVIFNLCMPYTSRDEITRAVECCAVQSLAQDHDDPPVTEKDIDLQLMTTVAECPPVDVLIRTSGVRRLSDFLLWQGCKDTQIHFVPTLWPVVGLLDWVPTILDYQRKVWNRRSTLTNTDSP
ncbi:Decaprenyl diphosphate synthase-like protein [Flammula alnicola]|nr:Decaprenyl diphosphate synthase-like protein [Flammula alnicola]